MLYSILWGHLLWGNLL